jgi:hypothetical protein
MVFHYFYINGINTPTKEYDDYQRLKRGNCWFERSVVMQNLLDLPPDPPLQTKPPLAPPSIKVKDEVDKMEPPTCNFSGKERFSRLAEQRCKESLPAAGNDPDGHEAAARAAICRVAAGFGAFADFVRGVDAGMSYGDLTQCFVQSLNLSQCFSPPLNPICKGVLALFPGVSQAWEPLTALAQQLGDAFKQPTERLDALAIENDNLVKDVAKKIVGIFQEEKGRRYQSKVINFFIVIGHSQGNFFVEGVGNRLMDLEGQDGSYVFTNRLGLVSLASPTAYETLPPRFREERIVHTTRRDDMIKIVNLAKGSGKTPWPDDQSAPLWPWKESVLNSMISNPVWVLTAFGLAPKNKFVGATGTGNPEQDDALYTPLMNSHLLENYLTNPPATMPCIPLNATFVEARELTTYCIGRTSMANVYGANGRASPQAAPVVDEVRDNLRGLKQRLIENLAEDRDRSPL